jgi:hypothetical protein
MALLALAQRFSLPFWALAASAQRFQAFKLDVSVALRACSRRV